jgi:hypothetical protein
MAVPLSVADVSSRASATFAALAGEAEPDLLDLPAAGRCWSALYTLSRREKKVARTCERDGIPHYLPLRPIQDRRTAQAMSAAPLFPGYLFGCLTAEARIELLRTGMIARVIPVPRPELLLAELRQIRAALAAGVDLEPAPAVERGMWVRVIGGPLDGVLGRVAERRFRRGRTWLVLNVSLLALGARAMVDVRDVEPLRAAGDGAGIVEVGAAETGAAAEGPKNPRMPALRSRMFQRPPG